MAEISNQELVALLNILLEAERAGAKVVAKFLDEYPRESSAWQQLHEVQHDEAHNCTLLMQALRSCGVQPSRATGDFLGKALAVQGRTERLAFLNRGQGWVARKLAEQLPHIATGPVRQMLSEMHDSHLVNIAACNDLVVSLSDASLS